MTHGSRPTYNCIALVLVTFLLFEKTEIDRRMDGRGVKYIHDFG
jgi:hypothetical protein